MIERIDSQKLETFPIEGFDLYHIDALHTFEGVQKELSLCAASAGDSSIIVVDDITNRKGSPKAGPVKVLNGAKAWLAKQKIWPDPVYVAELPGFTGELFLTRDRELFESTILGIPGIQNWG
jgi:hypothetical protein